MTKKQNTSQPVLHAKAINKGLTSAQVQQRTVLGQTNAFTQKTSRSAWSIIKANTFTLFNGIIAVCFVILAAVGHWQDLFFGFSAFTNAIIGSIQEFRAKQALDKLALISAQHAIVMRDTVEQQIPVADIVLDDLLVLRAGDEVPADAKVVDAFGLQLDQSMLTGESDAIDKKSGDEVLSGSVVVAGTGYAIVTRVGDSFANRFASDARRFSLVASEIRGSINNVLKFVAWIVGPIVALLLWSQITTQGGWSNIIHHSGAMEHVLVNTVASVIAMIPLGLVLITSVSFAVGAVKLTRQKVLVKELAAVEGLARVDMICLDKTGTLTEGTITFKNSYELGKEATRDWGAILAWYAVQPGANATARSLGSEFRDIPTQSFVREIQFSSARKWSAVCFEEGSVKGTWILGGPEMVFPNRHDDLQSKSKELAHTGQRTLVLGYSPSILDGKSEVLPADLEPVVLLAFQETVRSDAAKTLAYFKDQGVNVRIISGDNPDTVAAIARRVGLDASDGYDARNLPTDDEQLAATLKENIVFGRVTPEQKQRMVAALQASGYTVAMTGDGVNDTLAIKQADMGIAMNSGSAAAKAVARLVLLDSQFSHLPEVVEEGRQVIANIERISMLFLTKTTYAVGLAIVLSLMMLPFPFLPRQESIVDGLTIGLPALFLALLVNKKRYRPGFLKRSLSFAIPVGVIITAAIAIYARTATDMGVGEKMLHTGALFLLVFVGLWVLVALSRPLTMIKTVIISAMMAGLVLVFSVPPLVSFLGFVDLSGSVALLVAILAFGAICLIEIVRIIHGRVFTERVTKKKRLLELVAITIVAHVSALIMILTGVLFLFSRYIPEFTASERSAVTYLGAVMVMLGFLAVSIASGVSRGDRASRILLTIVLSTVLLLLILGVIFDGDLSVPLVIAIALFASPIAILWTGRRRRYFKEQ